MNTEEQDKLWQLLGKAKKTEVSPFFARNVLREIRPRNSSQGGFFSRGSRFWRLAGALTLPSIILLGIGFAPLFSRKPAVTPQALAMQLAPDDDTINHLDELLAYEENSIWLDNSSY